MQETPRHELLQLADQVEIFTDTYKGEQHSEVEHSQLSSSNERTCRFPRMNLQP